MRKAFLLFLFLLSVSTVVNSGIIDPPVSARATGLGYAGSTIHENGFAPYWNPAILPSLDNWNVALMQAKVGGDTQLYYAAYTRPLHRTIAFSLSWSNLVITDQGQTEILRDEAGRIIVDPFTGRPKEVVLGFYDESDNVVGLSLGAGNDRLGIGGSLKLIYNLFLDDRAAGVGGDLGMVMRLWRLRLGVAAKNLGDTQINWKKAADSSYPANLRLDGGLQLGQRTLGGVDTSLTGYIGGHFADQEERLDFGAELGLMRLLYLRLGAMGDDFCTGLGFEFDSLMVDYAFTQSEEFYSNHRISVELRGGKPGEKDDNYTPSP